MLLWKQPERTGNSFTLSHVEILGRFQEILCAEGQKQLKARASMEGPKDSKLYFFFFLIKLNSKTKFTSLPLPSWFPLHTHNTQTEAPTQKWNCSKDNETWWRRSLGLSVFEVKRSRSGMCGLICVCFLAKLEKEISRPRSWKRKWKIVRTFHIQIGLVQS